MALMLYRVARICLLPVGCALLVWGCGTGPNFVAKDEPWRKQEEIACLSSGAVRESSFLRTRSALGGPSEFCGAQRPFEMAAAGDGSVALVPPALVVCPMVPQINEWVTNVAARAAYQHLRSPLVALKVAASYSCRAMNNVDGANLSEHGHANAIDISGFVMGDGRVVTVKGGWNGRPEEQAFLRDVRSGSCQAFTTVLGPGFNAEHADHFHLDLARHGKDGLKRICK